ncbi:DUF4344 domain-containing metallopeptidase, partial [Nitrosopumilus sp.]|nr:DUF4344 domain-containing metallopeptidase [Nitrosopumilus sp.]
VNWWLDGSITDSQLFQGITFLTNSKIIKVSENMADFKNEKDMVVSIESDRGNFSNYYMKIENYGIEPYPGRIATPEPYSKDIRPEKIEVWLRHTQYFEKQVSDLNRNFKLPNNIYIGLGECQHKDAYYNKDSKTIIICYELIFDIHDKFLKEYETNGITEKQATVMTLNVIDYIFYHQLAHALYDTLYSLDNQKIEKNNEQMMNSFANQIKRSMQQDSKDNKIISVASWFKIMSETQNTKSVNVWNEHGIGFEKFFHMACENSGLDRIKTLNFMEKGFIPAEKLVQCKIKYIEQKEKLEFMISPIMK